MVIDPSEAGPVIGEIESQRLCLTQIWCTHHHHDHTGGVEELVNRYNPSHVIGSVYDFTHKRIPHQSHGVDEITDWQFGSHKVTVLELPGHTLGAVGYLIDEQLFTGDVLFVAGCGYVFEGTMRQMWLSLEKISRLKGSVQFYCGHEYTLANLMFAKTIEPQNESLHHKITEVKQSLALGNPSVPSLLEHEHQYNPFLRCRQPNVIAAAERLSSSTLDNSPERVFQILREAKNQFRMP